MTQYQETIRIKGKKYIIQWIDVDFNTFEHKEAINALTTCDELVNYDYTTGYPEKLVFNL